MGVITLEAELSLLKERDATLSVIAEAEGVFEEAKQSLSEALESSVEQLDRLMSERDVLCRALQDQAYLQDQLLQYADPMFNADWERLAECAILKHILRRSRPEGLFFYSRTSGKYGMPSCGTKAEPTHRCSKRDYNGPD